MFQTQKNLFGIAVNIASGALGKTSDTSDPSQYLVIALKKNSFEILSSSQELIIKVTIDQAGNLYKSDEEKTYVVGGAVLRALMEKSCVTDTMEVKAVEEEGSGSLNFSWRGPVEKEEWSIPWVNLEGLNIALNPAINIAGQDKLIVKSEEFQKFVNAVGVAVGKDSGDANYRNIMIRSNSSLYEVVATSVVQLAWAKGIPMSTVGEFAATVPYIHVASLSKLLNTDIETEIIYNKGKSATLVFRQDVIYGDRKIGEVLFRVTCSDDPFAKFEKVVKMLDYKSSCKVRTKQMQDVCGKLDVLQIVRTHVVLDTKKKALIFAKKDSGKGAGKGIAVPLVDVSGDDIELCVSGLHLSKAVNHALGDEIEWKFSGQKSLTCMVLAPNIAVYFPPFGDEE